MGIHIYIIPVCVEMYQFPHSHCFIFLWSKLVGNSVLHYNIAWLCSMMLLYSKAITER